MANKARGVIAAQLGDETIELALGLGALAELEDAFGVESFEEALNFGEKVSAKKMRTFLTALLRGNEIALTPERNKAVAVMAIDEFMALVASLAKASGLSQEAPAAAPAEGSAAPFEAANAGEPG